jgi:hypothetical protein
VHGITPSLLERSMRQVLAGDAGWVRPTSVICATTVACDIAFFDTVLKTRLKLHFAIEGEQRPGCWLGAMTDEPTFPAGQHVTSPAAAAGLGGCVSWLS